MGTSLAVTSRCSPVCGKPARPRSWPASFDGSRTGGDFLGRACTPARALVVSEESREHWAERLRLMPVGPHARLVARPFLTRPTPTSGPTWSTTRSKPRAAGELDLFVVDPLASFLPGRSESDPGTLLEMLQPLQRLAAAGVAVLVLHHPRKQPSDEGSAARGSGALLGFVDIILELHRFGRLQTDERRRRLIGLSRHRATPRQLVYEWDPATGEFTTVTDPLGERFRDNWEQVRAILARRTVGGDAPRAVGGLAGRPREAGGERVVRVAEPGDGGEAGPPPGHGPPGRPVPLPAAERGRRVLGSRRVAAAKGVGGFAAVRGPNRHHEIPPWDGGMSWCPCCHDLADPDSHTAHAHGPQCPRIAASKTSFAPLGLCCG